MTLCQIQGNSDMYGLGIRLGFYLQWFTRIMTDILLVHSRLTDHERRLVSLNMEVKGSRFALQCFIAATFIAIIDQAGNGAGTVIDLYVALLLCFGGFLHLIPTFAWRIVTGFNPLADPTRWSPVPRSIAYRILNHLLVLASAAFQLWFWAWKVKRDRPRDCQLYGFLFVKRPIESVGLRVVNILSQSVILLIAVAAPILMPFYTKGLDPKIKLSKTRGLLLQSLNALLGTFVFVLVVAAIELTVSWNDLEDVYSLSSTGQLIPCVIGAIIPVRILYKFCWPEDIEDRDLDLDPTEAEVSNPLSIAFSGVGRG